MKKIISILILTFVIQQSYAGGPLKFRAGLMGLGANHWMLSSGYKYSEGLTEYNYKPQFTFNINGGFVFGLNFTDALGVEVDVILGQYMQDWILETRTQNSTSEYKYTTEIKKVDVPVLFRAGGIMYVEIGPQFTFIQEVNEVPEEGASFESTDYYTSSQMFAVLGTGVSIEVPKIVRFDAGLRLAYGFQDISAHKEINGSPAMFNDESITQGFWGIKLAAIHEF